jgi:hypothetical protein
MTHTCKCKPYTTSFNNTTIFFSGAGVATDISVVETKNKHGGKSSSKMAFLKLHGDRFLFFKTYVMIGTCVPLHAWNFDFFIKKLGQQTFHELTDI